MLQYSNHPSSWTSNRGFMGKKRIEIELRLLDIPGARTRGWSALPESTEGRAVLRVPASAVESTSWHEALAGGAWVVFDRHATIPIQPRCPDAKIDTQNSRLWHFLASKLSIEFVRVCHFISRNCTDVIHDFLLQFVQNKRMCMQRQFPAVVSMQTLYPRWVSCHTDPHWSTVNSEINLDCDSFTLCLHSKPPTAQGPECPTPFTALNPASWPMLSSCSKKKGWFVQVVPRTSYLDVLGTAVLGEFTSEALSCNLVAASASIWFRTLQHPKSIWFIHRMHIMYHWVVF